MDALTTRSSEPFILPSRLKLPSREVEQKVRTLFGERRIAEFLDLAHIPRSERNDLVAALARLQGSIYRLDSYGEHTWLARTPQLEELWGAIGDGLARMGVAPSGTTRLLREMREYQEIEAGLREGRSALVVPIRDFYRLKTCDVRLARRLSLEIARVGSQGMLECWNYYDIASEVLDDLTDVTEDALTYNCNRFLISLRFRGVATTVQEYAGFLFGLAREIADAKRVRSGDWPQQLVLGWASDQATRVSVVLSPPEARTPWRVSLPFARPHSLTT